MAVWEWGVEALVAALVLLVLLAVALVVRRRWIARDGGTFELSYRMRSVTPGRGWVLGIGRYSGEELEWFRIFSLSPKPRLRWHRKTLAYVGRRDPEGIETMSLYPDHVVVRCETPDGPVEFAMSGPSLTGFQSWAESGPPGAEIR
ncbi:DUF2550 domain-containing protein [Nocardioides jejuensis]|uniref:DUF2550 family protein n=1 Tax=Nocardioides jejuensis TaxID=2502782 RepID=A0A4R1CIQ7_9ACTN|nr:DUF2550 domain-containing protein [Nocardioides jejuensis]TCJ31129.1 DUF2550 family protein [Nocardioides jejuensis]